MNKKHPFYKIYLIYFVVEGKRIYKVGFTQHNDVDDRFRELISKVKKYRVIKSWWVKNQIEASRIEKEVQDLIKEQAGVETFTNVVYESDDHMFSGHTETRKYNQMEVDTIKAYMDSIATTSVNEAYLMYGDNTHSDPIAPKLEKYFEGISEPTTKKTPVKSTLTRDDVWTKREILDYAKDTFNLNITFAQLENAMTRKLYKIGDMRVPGQSGRVGLYEKEAARALLASWSAPAEDIRFFE